jgi:glycopeptide antibiotics resistance protein
MIPKFLFPLLVYRDIAFPFLVLSSIATASWLAFRLYGHRTSGEPLSFRRELLLVTFVVYVSGLAAATLIPNRSSHFRAGNTVGIELHPDLASLTCSSATLPAGSAARSFCVRNARGNFILFFPLGILIPLVWTRIRFRSALLFATAVSCSIELVQYLSRAWSNRLADVNDIILNVLGASLGLALVFVWRSLSRARTPATDQE